jgi:hypothetical protein
MFTEDIEDAPDYWEVSNKIIRDIYEPFNKYGIAGEELRDLLRRLLGAEYAKEMLGGKMTEDDVLKDIERNNPSILKYTTKVFHNIALRDGKNLPT